MACLEPPFQEDTMQNLFKAILYKSPKPIHTCYSPKLNEFILKMLEKNKKNRTLVPDLIDFLINLVPLCNFNIKNNPTDYDNYLLYSDSCK